MNEKMVSIICIAYNHEKYIRKAIESFLMQKTSFDYEILIHDDASTDKTASIIKEYLERYPNIIRAVFQTENQYSKRFSPINILTEMAKGKYLAFCEGDDYWTDENKLETQIEILENFQQCVACAHNTTIVSDDEKPWSDAYQELYREKKDKIKDIGYICKEGKFSHTACLVVRRTIFSDMSIEQKSEYFKLWVNDDMKWAAIIASYGKLYHIAKDMACYRCVINGNDSWTAKNHNKNIYYITYEMMEKINQFIKKYYDIDIDYSRYYAKLTLGALKNYFNTKNNDDFRIFKKLYHAQKSKIKLLYYMILYYVVDICKRIYRKLKRGLHGYYE